MRIRWGLRSLDIPITEVEWVRPVEDLLIPLKMPAFSTPGAILGEGYHPDLGKVRVHRLLSAKPRHRGNHEPGGHPLTG